MDIEVEGTCFLGKSKIVSLCETKQGTMHDPKTRVENLFFNLFFNL